MTSRKRSPVIETLEDRLCMDTGAVPSMFAGSPVRLPATGAWTQTPFFGSPIFADLRGDGHQEVIVAAAGGKMIAYGTNAQGQIVKFQEYDTTPLPGGVQGNFKSTPVVVNVPGVGTVLVGALGRDEAHPGTAEDGRVYAFNAVTGQVLWVQNTSLPAPNTFAQSGVTGPLTIGYLENNGMPDVIVDSFSTLVTAFRVSNGSKLWQYSADDTVEPGAVVTDLYGDGKQEVIITDGISPSHYYKPGGFITILNQDGSLNRRIFVGENITAAPIVADLFGDGRKEIIAAPRGYFDGLPGYSAAQQAAFRAAGNRVYAFFPDGSTVPGWPYHTTGNDALKAQVWKDPVAADLYGNGQSEVIVVDRLGVLHVILPGGQDAPGFAGGKSINPGVVDTFGSPIVADVNGSGRQDIIVSDEYVIAAYAPDGTQLFSTFTPNTPNSSNPNLINSAGAYGRFDPSGVPALAFVSASGTAPGAPQFLTVYQLPQTSTPPAWPMDRKTPQGQAVQLSTVAQKAVVIRSYQALFLRAPNQAEIDYYVPLLTSGAISTFDLAASLGKATEGLRNFPGPLGSYDVDTTNKVNKIYGLIGQAVPSDSLASVLYDAHRGRTYDAAAILIVGSNGNYAATSYVAPWARSVYRDIFHILPSNDQVAAVVRSVDQGKGMGEVVKGLLNSSDARKGYVISQIAVYLGRGATGSDLALANYARREDVVTAIVASPEFFTKNGNTVSSFVNAAYSAIDGFLPDSGSASYWVDQINKGASSRATLAKALATNNAYYNAFVVNSLFAYTPDPSKGVLRVQVGVPGSPPPTATNPDPNLVAAYTNQLLSGAATQEVVIASMLTSSQYVSNSTYFRGIYVSPGIRV